LTSWIQSSPVGALSTKVASVGDSEAGILVFFAPAADAGDNCAALFFPLAPPALTERDALPADGFAALRDLAETTSASAPPRTFAATERFECHSFALSRAISSRLRPDTTLSGSSSTMRAAAPSFAYSSLSLISSHACLPDLPPYLLLCVRIRSQPPLSFSPSSSNLRCPF